MFSGSIKPLSRLGFVIGLVVALTVFGATGFAQDKTKGRTDTNTQYPHLDLNHPDQYVGQQVTLVGDVNKIHSSSAFIMEAKDQGTKDHILVIAIAPAHPEGTV